MFAEKTMRFERIAAAAAIFAVLQACQCGAVTPDPDASVSQMRPLIERFTADRQSLLHLYPVQISPERAARLNMFYNEELVSLGKINFDSLSEDDQIDYLLLKNYAQSQLHLAAIQTQQADQLKPLLPFAATIIALDEARRQMKPVDAEDAARQLSEMVKLIETTKQSLEAQLAKGKTDPSAPRPDKVVANRAVIALRNLDEALKHWFDFYNGYDPAFTWWMGVPYKHAQEALTGYSGFLKEKVIGIGANDRTTIIGNPVGREALMAELADNLIPYTPEELILIAQTEMDWCMQEMLKASREMGDGDDWNKALEHVKTMHVEPGQQPELIRKLVVEGADFAETHNLVTIPEIAKESWRMEMMSPERQLINPFFTGGSIISVSYPTDTMTYDQRMMSMRGNNIPFARATAFHEVLPGHYLQQFMSERYRPYRRLFSTPFWSEGNAFYWEMLFWDKGFATTPEERVGMLFWRMHRSARVIFTMRFHLGQWTPEQCVDFLIHAVGHEPDNAAAEVRRSFDGSDGPLYQCAYLLGALQFRALHRELVDTGKMTNRQFNDAVLQQNEMPVEMVRAALTHQRLTRDFTASWKFYGPHPGQ